MGLFMYPTNDPLTKRREPSMAFEPEAQARTSLNQLNPGDQVQTLPLPTEAEVRRELNLPDDVEVRVIPFSQLGGAKTIEEAIRHLRAGRGRAMPPEPEIEEPATAAVTDAARDALDPASFRDYERSTKILDICFEVFQEVKRARAKHPVGAHSAHEGHSILREEVEELWAHVKADTGRSPEARKEAIQSAAMAVRYIIDLID